ncbi:MAG TPA: aminoglycoside phosphotransferase family protein [Acidimicrobiales bacterium]
MDKKDITVDVVVALLREQFPQWAHLPVRRVDVDGNDNTSFRLGDELLVRLPSHERYVLGVEKEHRWLPMLAEQLPLPIPQPVAKGEPSDGVFPRIWSVYRWLDGEIASVNPPTDRTAFAVDVADFLAALYRIDTAGGPPAGEQSFWRGAPLERYDRQTRKAIADLGDAVAADAASAVWDAALAATYANEPVWVHGDVAQNNLLVRDGRLSAVIDFGTSAVGDPACDAVLAWTFLDGESRRAFRERLPVDRDTWVRGRGWALWKALISLAWNPRRNPAFTEECRRVVADVIAEHETEASSTG